MIQCHALDIFPQHALGYGPAFWIFLLDSPIRINPESECTSYGMSHTSCKDLGENNIAFICSPYVGYMMNMAPKRAILFSPRSFITR